MQFALTTRWNAGRHTDGAAMIDEILDLGFDCVELGYDTRLDLVPGVRNRVEQGAVRVHSVHNYCPVPMTAHRGHPEIFTFGHKDRHIRKLAVRHTADTIRFAADIGARVVVCHCGNIDMTRYSEQLIELIAQGRQFTPAYEKLKLKLQDKREKKARKQLAYWYECLEQLLPVLDENRIQLAMENLPTWESIPTETEIETALNQFQSPWLKYWHDMGHGQIREAMGLINVHKWLERLEPMLVGLHVHDFLPPACDHVMPPRGEMDFSRYKRVANRTIERVIEPTPQTPPEEIREALSFLQACWGPEKQTTNHQEEEREG